MNEAVSYVIGFLITMPIVTLLHEFGHAIPQLIKRYRVVIQIGGLDNSTICKFGKFYIRIAPFSMFNGFCSISTRGSKTRRALVFLCGPLASLVIAVCFYMFSFQNYGYWVNFQINLALYFSSFQALFTLLPIQYSNFFWGYSGIKSDGLQAWELLKSEHK